MLTFLNNIILAFQILFKNLTIIYTQSYCTYLHYKLKINVYSIVIYFSTHLYTSKQDRAGRYQALNVLS